MIKRNNLYLYSVDKILPWGYYYFNCLLFVSPVVLCEKIVPRNDYLEKCRLAFDYE